MRLRNFCVENLRHVGWQGYRVESYVNWCGRRPIVSAITAANMPDAENAQPRMPSARTP